MKSRGYIDEKLGEQSMRYITVWKNGQPKPGDNFKNHPLLLLGVLDHQDHTVTRECTGCERASPDSAFSSEAGDAQADRQCFVCSAVHGRKQY
jgi:hypothetical protein